MRRRSLIIIPVIGDGLNVDLKGRGKFDIASKASGLGSGRNDFSLATGLPYETKNWEPYVELGYKWRGKSDDPDLLNQSALTAGAKFIFDRSSILISPTMFAVNRLPMNVQQGRPVWPFHHG